MKKISALIPLTILGLQACSELASINHTYLEPKSDNSAKARIVTNGTVRFIPNRSCVDWKAPGTGMVASTQHFTAMSPTLNGKKIGMTNASEINPRYATAEVLLTANTPLTVVFTAEEDDSFMNRWCEPVSVAFIPVAGEEYEISGMMTDYCIVRIKSLSWPSQYPAQKTVSSCN